MFGTRSWKNMQLCFGNIYRMKNISTAVVPTLALPSGFKWRWLIDNWSWAGGIGYEEYLKHIYTLYVYYLYQYETIYIFEVICDKFKVYVLKSVLK